MRAEIRNPISSSNWTAGASTCCRRQSRFARIARGGLRCSDRAEDFRTEILSLAKAQQVKNAVIVPVGAKGGFYPKRLPKGGSADAVRAEGISAYRTFLYGLLD